MCTNLDLILLIPGMQYLLSLSPSLSPFLPLSFTSSSTFFSCRYVFSKATFSQGTDLRHVALFLEIFAWQVLRLPYGLVAISFGHN